MAEECTVVRFSRDSSLARIEHLKVDSPDKISENTHSFGAFYIFCIILSIATYIVDLTLTGVLLYFYITKGFGLYFALTLTFTLFPAIFVTTVSLRWYIIDHDDPSVGRSSLGPWVIRMVFLLLQISPLLRYIDTLIYGIKSKIAGTIESDSQQTILYRRMLDEDSNSSLLRLFHCFLHCAPQAVIQLVFLLDFVLHPENKHSITSDIALVQAWTVITGVISIAWALASYHRSVRYARDDKDKIKWIGLLVAFCWQLMSALSRILALSLLAAILPTWMGVICALHWGMMSIWLVLGHHQTAVCNSCEEILLSMALGCAYVLAFVSPRDGPTRYLYLVYYLVCFMENTGALVVWCVQINSSNNPFLYYGAAGSQVIAFVLGIIFLIIYYKYCHPSRLHSTKIPRDLDNDKPCYSKTSYSLRTSS